MQGPAEKLFRSDSHSFSKYEEPQLTLITGVGIEGDAHAGEFVKHRWDAARKPKEKNLRQVHLIASEALASLVPLGFDVPAGALGENISTSGLDLINLPLHSELAIGDVVLHVNGLRSPCKHIENYQTGLLKHMITKDENGEAVRKTGIMTDVVQGGVIAAGAPIIVHLPKGEHKKLPVL
jgi:MOSC domain-containing protein YiiM